MYYFNDKLLLSLLLSSALLIAHSDQDNKKENDLVLNICENLPKLLSCVILKRYVETLPAEKFVAAEILKRYIAHNTECSEDTAKKIAQCTVSLARFSIKNKKGDDPIYGYTLEDKPWISIPKTLAREFLLSESIRLGHEAADKLEIKHPPEIKENKKLYLGGKFLIKSVARHAIDYVLNKLLSKIGIRSPGY